MGKKIEKIFNQNKSGELKVENPKSKCVYKFLGHYNISYTANSNGEITNFYINEIETSIEEAKHILNLEDRSIEKFI